MECPEMELNINLRPTNQLQIVEKIIWKQFCKPEIFVEVKETRNN